ncbi:MAG: trigger factor family protein, partial [Phycisphaerales bacterium]|nr:trigger factor family protein [Phycisphaerales bacterium]
PPRQPASPAVESPAVDASLATADQAPAKPKLEQTVSLSDVGPARKALLIEIPEDRIQVKLKEQMGKLKTDAAIPGFRKGRAPMRLIENASVNRCAKMCVASSSAKATARPSKNKTGSARRARGQGPGQTATARQRADDGDRGGGSGARV